MDYRSLYLVLTTALVGCFPAIAMDGSAGDPKTPARRRCVVVISPQVSQAITKVQKVECDSWTSKGDILRWFSLSGSNIRTYQLNDDLLDTLLLHDDLLEKYQQCMIDLCSLEREKGNVDILLGLKGQTLVINSNILTQLQVLQVQEQRRDERARLLPDHSVNSDRKKEGCCVVL